GAIVARENGAQYGFACGEGQRIDFNAGGVYMQLLSTVPGPRQSEPFIVKHAVFGALSDGTPKSAKAENVTGKVQDLCRQSRTAHSAEGVHLFHSMPFAHSGASRSLPSRSSAGSCSRFLL